MKPHWQDDSVILYHGDAREVLPQLAGQADLLLTDPPYGISDDSGKRAQGKCGPKGDRLRDFGAADLDLAEARSLLYDIIDLGVPLLAPTASIYLWLSHGLFAVAEERLRDTSWMTRPLVWIKPNAPPPMPGCFPGGIELCLHAYRNGRIWNQIGWHSAAVAVNAIARAHEGEHPTSKPLRLMERCILASTNPGGLVLDCCSGSGSTLVAARALGRRAIGIEKDEGWCEEAAHRLSQATLNFKEAEE